jgi:hypothetical protein
MTSEINAVTYISAEAHAKVVDLIASRKDDCVSVWAVAAALVNVDNLYSERGMWLPPGGVAAFKTTAHRYFLKADGSHDNDTVVAVMTELSELLSVSNVSSDDFTKALARKGNYTFWITMEEHAPMMAPLALKLTCGAFASQSCQERNNGQVGDILTADRCRLDQDTVQQLMTVKSVMAMGSKVSAITTRTPIMEDVHTEYLEMRARRGDALLMDDEDFDADEEAEYEPFDYDMYPEPEEDADAWGAAGDAEGGAEGGAAGGALLAAAPPVVPMADIGQPSAPSNPWVTD